MLGYPEEASRFEEFLRASAFLRPAGEAYSRRAVPYCGEVPATLRPGLRPANSFQDLQTWGEERSLALWEKSTCLQRWGLFQSWNIKRVRWSDSPRRATRVEYFHTVRCLAAGRKTTALPVWVPVDFFRERTGWPLFVVLNHYF